MKPRARISIGLALSASLVALGLAGASTAGAHPVRSAKARTVSVHLHKFSVGKALVNSRGRAMYMFLKDTHNKSHCKPSGCTAIWPPVMSKHRPVAGSGVSQRHLRRLSTGQVAYYGHPLYYYVLDKTGGTDKGENKKEFGARWFVVSAKGAALKPKKPAGGGNPTPPYIPPAPTTAAAVTSATVNSTELLKNAADDKVLYYLTGDEHGDGSFSCTDTCQQLWIPLMTDGAPSATGDASSAALGTIARGDDKGETQVTYNGYPVYEYAPDSTATASGNLVYDPPGYWYDIALAG